MKYSLWEHEIRSANEMPLGMRALLREEGVAENTATGGVGVHFG